MVSTKDVSIGAFESTILKEHGDLLDEAVKEGLEVRKIIEEMYAAHAETVFQAAIGRTVTTIKSKLAYKKSKMVTGVIAGMADSAMFNLPVSFAILGTDGRNYQVNIGWRETKIKSADKSKMIQVPTLAKAKIAIVEETWKDRKSWKLTGIEASDKIETTKELLETLDKIDAIRPIDDLINTKQGQVIATKLRVQYVGCSTRKPSKDEIEKAVELGMDEEEAKKRIPLPVFAPDLNKLNSMHPQFTLSGTTPEDVQYYIYLEGARNIAKTIDIAGIAKSCEDAVAEFKGNPEEQADFLQGDLAGREIVVVARISGVNTESDKHAAIVSMSVISVFEIPVDIEVEAKKNEPQKELGKEPAKLDFSIPDDEHSTPEELGLKKVTSEDPELKKFKEAVAQKEADNQKRMAEDERAAEEEAEQKEKKEEEKSPAAVKRIQENIRIVAKLKSGKEKAMKKDIQSLDFKELIEKFEINKWKDPVSGELHEYSENLAKMVLKEMSK